MRFFMTWKPIIWLMGIIRSFGTSWMWNIPAVQRGQAAICCGVISLRWICLQGQPSIWFFMIHMGLPIKVEVSPPMHGRPTAQPHILFGWTIRIAPARPLAKAALVGFVSLWGLLISKLAGAGLALCLCRFCLLLFFSLPFSAPL